jgi:hypothetical protein
MQLGKSLLQGFRSDRSLQQNLQCIHLRILDRTRHSSDAPSRDCSRSN